MPRARMVVHQGTPAEPSSGERTEAGCENGVDWTERLPAIAEAAGSLKRPCMINGESISARPDGLGDFHPRKKTRQGGYRVTDATPIGHERSDRRLSPPGTPSPLPITPARISAPCSQDY